MSYENTACAASLPTSTGNEHATVDVRKSSTHHAAHSRSPSYWDSLLAMNPKDFANDPEKLAGRFVSLQTLCKEQRAELAKYQQDELDRSKTAGSSRTATEQSDPSTKKPILQPQDTRRGVAIVLNPSNNKVKVVQRRGMKDSDYITADLPSFHWWQDCLHIYFPKDGELDAGTKSQKVLVRQSKFERSKEGEWEWFCSVKLAKLGLGIRLKRIFGLGNLNLLYVLAPGQELARGIEMVSMKSQQGTVPK